MSRRGKTPKFIPGTRITDLTGQTFHEWTVLSYQGKHHKSKHPLWLCKCSCGTERSVDGSTLQNGRSKSCGCQPHKKHRPTQECLPGTRILNLTGLQFSQWKVLSYVGKDDFGCSIWLCQCSCGVEKKVSSNNLKRGISTSCGDLQRHGIRGNGFDDITGQKFARLTVFGYAGSKQVGTQTRSMWKCKCECGELTVVPATALKSGNTLSCGCLQKETRPNFIDLTGQVFGKLTVLQEAEDRKGSKRVFWVCRCECGTIKTFQGSNLRKGHTRSCGCLPPPNFVPMEGKKNGRLTILRKDVEKSKKRSATYWICKCECGQVTSKSRKQLISGKPQSCGCLRLEAVTKHGKSRTRIYTIWKGMRRRCYRPNSRGYEYYGGRGIQVCQEWHEFEQFCMDMGEPPSKKHTLDRIDPNGDYCRENCRWATMKEQRRNTRGTVFHTYNGKTQSMYDWAEEYGIEYYKFLTRLRYGFSFEEALGVIE